jgi:YesN/AraC family two-component response regulator
MAATSRPHLLVVDDDPSIREALATALAFAYVVHVAATGDEACLALQTHPTHAIILDAILGDEDGLALVDRFRALSDAPILILTGYSTEELAIRAVRAQVSDYLKKPVSIGELEVILARVLHRAEAQADPVTRARHALEEQAERTHTTAILAREVGMSEGHLRRRFRQAHGRSPRRYQIELRLRRAAELLLTTGLNVNQIASEVGYRSVRTFNRWFKQFFGVTPSEYRISRGHRSP